MTWVNFSTSTRLNGNSRGVALAHHRRRAAVLAAAVPALIGTSSPVLATIYQYTGTGTVSQPATGVLSTGFGASPTTFTNVDVMTFNGSATSTYSAVDDLTSPIVVNGLRFDGVSNVSSASINLNRGGTGTSNLIQLGGSNPYVNFNTSAIGITTVATDLEFQTSGFIVKSFAQASTAPDPIISGNLILDPGANLLVSLSDSGGDGKAELSLTGNLSGSGNLTLNNFYNNTSPSVPFPSGVAPIASPIGNVADFGTLFLSGNNSSYSGTVNISYGRIVINNANALGTGMVNITGQNGSGGTLEIGGNVNNGAANYGTFPTGVTSVTIANNFTLGGQNIGGSFSGNYSASIRNDAGNNTLTGTITLTKALVDIAVGNLTTLTLSNNVNQSSGIAGVLAKTGNGNLILTGANNTFTGGINSSGGGIVTFTNSFPTTTYILLNNGGLTINPATFGSAQAALAAYPRFNGSSNGAILLTASETNNLNFVALYNVATGAASGSSVTLSGLLTAGSNGYKLGGGGGTLAISATNALTGTGGLIANQLNVSAGTVLLQAPQNYSGPTTVYSGTLGFVTGGLGTGQLTLASGGIEFLDNNTTDFSSPSRNIVLASGTNASAVETVNAINTNGNNATIAGQFLGVTTMTATGTTVAYGDLRKTGLGTLTLPNAATAAHIFVNGGTLAATGSQSLLVYTGYSSIGQNAGDNATLNLDNGANYSGSGDFNVADNGGSATAGTAVDSGTVNINNSTGSATATTLNTVAFYVGKGGAANNLAVGVVNQFAGTVVNATNQQWIGSYGTGTYNQYGGILNVSNSNITLGRNPGSVGTFNLSGGTINVIGTTGNIYVAESGTGVLNISPGTAINIAKLDVAAGTGNLAANGTVNQNGGIVSATGNGVVFGTFAGANVAAQPVVGVYNLNGGTLLVPQVSQIVNNTGAISGTFNFNGGTLQASAGALSPFISGLTAANVQAGGAVIENSGQNITIGQSLLHAGTGPTDGGLKLSGAGVVTISSTGNTYAGATNITAGTLRLAAAGTVVNTIPAGSVQAYYSFEDPNNLLNDSSPNQNTLAPISNINTGIQQGNYSSSTNAPPSSSTTGTHGGSIALANSSSFTTQSNAFPVGVPIGNTAYTIGAWIDGSGNTTTGTNYGIVGWGSYSVTNAANTFHVANADGGTVNGIDNVWRNNDSTGLIPGGGQSAVNQWHYVAVTYDPVANIRTLYVDGQVVAQDSPAGTHNVTGINFTVGETGNAPANYFDGNMADLIIASTAYTPGQLQLAEQNNLSGSITTMVAGGQLPFNTVVQVGATATFDLNGNNQTIGGLTGPAGGQVTLGSGTLTVGTTTAGEFDGVVSGTGGLFVGGTAALTLGGINTFTGGTSVDTGAILTVTGAGRLPQGGNLGSSGTVNFMPGAGPGINARTLGTIAVGTGGQINLQPATTHATRTLLTAVNITVAPGGSVDVSNNDLDLTGASLSAITALVANGYNLVGGANWAGTGGITSSSAASDATHLTALGVIQNNQGGTPLYGVGTMFAGANPGASDILVKYTYFGDANLDGKVDGSDYSLIDAGYVSHGSLSGWYNGDFNYDGTIDGSDYALLDNAFNNQGSQITTPTALVATATAQTAAVPEPATLGLLAIAGLGLLGRRRSGKI